MDSDQRNIVVVGGGVAGLVAAFHLEKAGFKPVLIDENDRVGGRVSTDYEDGYQLDHGFQVLLTGYKEARQYLDFEKLELKYFEAGAIVFDGERRMDLYDPLRDWTKGPQMAFSGIGTAQDKWLIWKLTSELKSQAVESVFKKEALSTLAFLKGYGFSPQIIHNFFKPFFGGIFLENELATSANMFRFVFKMFSEGQAAIPNAGIEAIVQQLKDKLEQTTILTHTKVKSVEAAHLVLANGELLPFHKLILAVPPNAIVPGLPNTSISWNRTLNLYFKSLDTILDRKAIALVASPGHLINNFCVLSDIAAGYSPSAEYLISVTLKDHVIWNENLPGQVANELEQFTKLRADSFTYLKHFEISKAIPKLEDVVYSIQPTQTLLRENVFLAGDYLLNGSLDAAMRSGRLAAEALWKS